MLDPHVFDISPEYSPMSGLDDLLIHNHPFPVRVMWTSDLQAYERVWFSSYDMTGDLLLVVGLGFYPNLGTADAFAIVNYRGQHTTVRGHRILGDNRLDMGIGPLKLEVIKPFGEWRLSLGENEYGIGFDIRWFDTTRAIFKDMGDIIDRGRATHPISGYGTFGVQEGWIRIGDEVHPVSRNEFRGTRDHHWGARDTVGGPSPFAGLIMRHVHSGEFVAFRDFALFGGIFHTSADSREYSELRSAKRKLHFDPETKMLLGGEAELSFADGTDKRYTFERLGSQIAHLRCGMYGGLGGKGGTPNGDIWHGQYVADYALTGETYDTNDPQVETEICGLDECVARFECDGEVAFGMTETVNTVCYEAALTGQHGLSLADPK